MRVLTEMTRLVAAGARPSRQAQRLRRKQDHFQREWPHLKSYNGLMLTASITQAKNGLSALIDRVRRGEVVVITDRGRPVARLESVLHGADMDTTGRIARLEREGAVRRAHRKKPSVQVFRPPPKARRGFDIVQGLLDERAEG